MDKMILFWLIINFVGVHARSPFVQTKFGIIEGTFQNYRTENEVAAFLGVPFAQPPTGPLRFKRPVPICPWTEPLKATQNPPACPQYIAAFSPTFDYLPGKSEDCLYMNIWVPMSNQEPKAVMFWIHSGKNEQGSVRLDEYDGRVLAGEGNVIVVTTNYRLGPLGFAYFDRFDIEGNMGIYDIIEALKWTYENIHSFGGDGEQITIAGHSAGSMTVSMFAVSPLTKPYFKRMIMESGAFSPLVPVSPESNYNRTIDIAKAVGCTYDVKSDTEIDIDCLRNVDAELLMKANREMKGGFIPQIRDDFLPTDPKVSLNTNNFKSCELLLGDTSDEAAFSLIYLAPGIFGKYGEKNPTFSKTFARKLAKKNTKAFPKQDVLINYYLDPIKDNFQNRLKIRNQTYRIYGDFRYTCPDTYFAEKMAETNNVYFYYFVHRPSNSPWAKWMGVVHFDEVQFVFGRPIRRPEEYTNSEIKLSRQMVEAWSNFIKTGQPHSKPGDWPPYSKSSPLIRILDTSSKIKIGSGPETKNCNFQRPLQNIT